MKKRKIKTNRFNLENEKGLLNRCGKEIAFQWSKNKT